MNLILFWSVEIGKSIVELLVSIVVWFIVVVADCSVVDVLEWSIGCEVV